MLLWTIRALQVDETKRCLAKGTQMSHWSLESIHNMIEYIHHDMAMALNQCGFPQSTVSCIYILCPSVSLISHRWHLSTIASKDHIHHHVDPRCVSVHRHLCRQKTNVSFIVIQTSIDKDYKLRRLWLSSMNSQKNTNNTLIKSRNTTKRRTHHYTPLCTLAFFWTRLLDISHHY